MASEPEVMGALSPSFSHLCRRVSLFISYQQSCPTLNQQLACIIVPMLARERKSHLSPD